MEASMMDSGMLDHDSPRGNTAGEAIQAAKDRSDFKNAAAAAAAAATGVNLQLYLMAS